MARKIGVSSPAAFCASAHHGIVWHGLSWKCQ
jgi:hypothetical protein